MRRRDETVATTRERELFVLFSALPIAFEMGRKVSLIVQYNVCIHWNITKQLMNAFAQHFLDDRHTHKRDPLGSRSFSSTCTHCEVVAVAAAGAAGEEDAPPFSLDALYSSNWASK